MVLENTLESPLNCKEIKPVHPKGNQSWVFIGRTDAEAETPILWPPDAKNWLIGKEPDAGKDWRQEEKGMTEDEMVGWHHWLHGYEFEQAPGVGDWQKGLATAVHGVAKSRTQLRDWTELREPPYFFFHVRAHWKNSHLWPSKWAIIKYWVCLYLDLGLLSFCAAAKSLQSFPTLCDPIDGSSPGSPIPGILQARTLEWVAISFSNAWKWKWKVKLLSRVRLLVTPWTRTVTNVFLLLKRHTDYGIFIAA